MFNRVKTIFALRANNKKRLKRISFLFKGGYYIFLRDRICRLNAINVKSVGFLRSLFFIYRVSNKGVKKEQLIKARVITGSYKHAVISDKLCYLVFKEQSDYFIFRKNYFDNIEHFNYPCISPILCEDVLFYVVEPIASGRTLKYDEIPELLHTLLKLFENQSFVMKDEKDILYYVQHGDSLPYNSVMDGEGNIVFIDLDSIASRPALYDFFNVICRTQGFDLLLQARENFDKELEIAFVKHNIKYTKSIYDLYLSKFVEARLFDIKNGYNNGLLYKSLEWMFDPIVKEKFPLTHELVGKYKFELTINGYTVN